MSKAFIREALNSSFKLYLDLHVKMSKTHYTSAIIFSFPVQRAQVVGVGVFAQTKKWEIQSQCNASLT